MDEKIFSGGETFFLFYLIFLFIFFSFFLFFFILFFLLYLYIYFVCRLFTTPPVGYLPHPCSISTTPCRLFTTPSTTPCRLFTPRGLIFYHRGDPSRKRSMRCRFWKIQTFQPDSLLWDARNSLPVALYGVFWARVGI